MNEDLCLLTQCPNIYKPIQAWYDGILHVLNELETEPTDVNDTLEKVNEFKWI